MRKQRESVAPRVKDLILNTMKPGEMITTTELTYRAWQKSEARFNFGQYQVHNAISNAMHSPSNVIRGVAKIHKESGRLYITRKGAPAVPKNLEPAAGYKGLVKDLAALVERNGELEAAMALIKDVLEEAGV